jgi:cell division protein FtsB
VDHSAVGSGRARRAGDTSRRLWAVRLGVALTLALGVAYLPYRLVGGRSGAQLDRMRGELDRARGTIGRLRAENAERKREIEALKNQPTAIEDIARHELGMVREGELVLRFERPEDR